MQKHNITYLFIVFGLLYASGGGSSGLQLGIKESPFVTAKSSTQVRKALPVISGANSSKSVATVSTFPKSKYGAKGAPEVRIPQTWYSGNNTRTEDFTLMIFDSYGDGWDGAYMDVSVNGVNVLDGIAFDEYCDDYYYYYYDECSSASFALTVNDGDLVETVYTAGEDDGNEEEHSYAFYDQLGDLVASDGPSPGTGISFTVSISSDIPGCTDDTACNYNSEATEDDGSCCLTNCTTVAVGGGSYASEVTWEILDLDGNAVASGGAPVSEFVCFDDGDYTVNGYDAWGDGWNGNVLTVTDNDGNVVAELTFDDGSAGSTTFSLPYTVGTITGCMTAEACNYNSEATEDDDSCCLTNCTTVDVGGGTWASEVTWEILDLDGNAVASGGAPVSEFACFDDGDYTVNGYDSYGDGWSGNVLTVTDDDGNVVAELTFDEGSEGSTTFSIPYVENYAAILITSPIDGAILYSSDATVTFTVSDFTVAAAGGGDGHIHYSLDDGTTVMQYTEDDIELAGLSVSDHTFAIWLVDNNHESLDPPVADEVMFTVQEPDDPPIVENLTATGGLGQVHLEWDMPPSGYEDENVSYDSGVFDNSLWMSTGSAIMGTYFTMPYGSNSAYINSAEVYGVPGASGATILYGYNIVDGVPEDTYTYDTFITTEEGAWTGVNDLGWTFQGDFLLAIEVSTSVGVAIDASNSPSMHSWMFLDSWDTWYDASMEFGLSDGEFGIRAGGVTSVGENIDDITFNVYKSDINGYYWLVSGDQTDTEYMDYDVYNETEYCYTVTSVLDDTEGPAGYPACATTGLLTSTISMGNVLGLPGDTVAVGVSIDMGDGYSINSYEMSFGDWSGFDIEFLGIDTSGTLTGQLGWLVSVNDHDTSVTVASAGDAAMTGEGILLRLRFAIGLDAQADEIIIFPYDVLLNEDDDLGIMYSDGSIVIPECAGNYVTIYCDGGEWQSEVSWSLLNSDGDEVAAGGAPYYESDFCLPSDVYFLHMYDSFGDGWNGNIWGIYDIVSGSDVVSLTLENGAEGLEIFVLGDAEHFLGCMDPDAINYNADATLDDGSCIYNGDLCSAAIEAVEGDAGNLADGDDEWFSYTATMDGYITVTTCHADQPEDTDVYIYSGCPDDNGYIIDSNDDFNCEGNAYASQVTIPVESGQTYFILWDDTWTPGPFTWYLYEILLQDGPENLTAAGGIGSVSLEWDPASPFSSFRGDPSSPLAGSFGSIQDEYERSLEKKKIINANRPVKRARSREQLAESAARWGGLPYRYHRANDQENRNSRNTSVWVTFYDSWGDGYWGDGYLIDDAGETVASFPGSNWGSEISYGPYDLADGVYSITVEGSYYASETTWDVEVDGTWEELASGGVPTTTYFVVGEGELPQADLSFTGLWYDYDTDAISVEITNTGDMDAGDFFVAYYLLYDTDASCDNDNSDDYSLVEGLGAGESIVAVSSSGIAAYMGGYGEYTFGAMVDYSCDIDESDEDNNTITETFHMLDGIEWNIYRQDGDNEFSMIGTVDSDPEYTDFQVTGGTEYCYFVTELENDTESDSSNHDCATPAAGTIIVDPYPIEFNDVLAGLGAQGPSTDITISNGSADDDLVISSVSITGDDTDHFQLTDDNSYPVTLATSTESIALSVRFAPQTTGYWAASLYIDAGTQVFSVPLSGRGYLPAPAGLSAIGSDAQVDLDWSLPVQGDVVTSPFFVTEIPFTAEGTTEGFNNDYDGYTGSGTGCPYGGSTAPDVVYRFDSPGGTYDFSVCESDYDTKIYIYDVSMTNIACNDDGCANSAGELYRSLLESVSLDEGTYFVIVDGYGEFSGDYQLEITSSGSRSYSYSYDPADKKLPVDPVAVYQERGSGFLSLSSELLQGTNNLRNLDAVNEVSRDRDVIAHYNIYRSRDMEDDAEDYTLISTVSSDDSPPYADIEVDNGIRYYYSVSALDDIYGESDFSSVSSAFPMSAVELPYMADLENDDGGFVRDDITQWGWGTPGFGPDGAFSGENVWGTNLSGSYQENSEDLLYNTFNMPESNYPVFFRFSIWHDLESDYDYLNVVVDHDNDGAWDVIDSFTGASDGWEEITIELPEEYRSSYTRLGFLLDSDVSGNAAGAYIDDIVVLIAGQPVVTTTQDDVASATEEVIYSLPISFTDTDGASANEYQVELTGSATSWLSIDGVHGSNGSYTIDIGGMPDDENLYDNVLSVTVTDATDIQSQPAGFTLEIVSVNDVPQITGYEGQAEFDEDEELTLSLYDFTVNDPDNTFPGDFVSQGLTVYEGDHYSVNGQTITPDANYHGPLTVPVTLHDGGDESAPFNLSLDVLSVNDIPVITTSDADEATEEAAYSMNIDFTDVEGTLYGLEFTVDVSGSATEWLSVGGDVSVNEQGSYSVLITGTPDDENLDDNNLVVSVSDGDDGVGTASFTVNIVPVNDAPEITGYVDDMVTEVNEDGQLTLSIYLFTVDDPDNSFPGDFVSQGLTVYEGDHYTFNGQTITPDENYHGELIVPITVHDGTDESAPFDLSLTVLSVNDMPIITTSSADGATEEIAYTFNIGFTDADESDAGGYNLSIYGSASEWLTVGDITQEASNYTVALTGTPDDGNLNQNALNVWLTDPNGGSASANYFFEIAAVNDIPEITEFLGPTDFDEDTETTLSLYLLTVEDPDNAFPADFVSQGLIVNDGDHYTVSGQTITPEENYHGEIVVHLQVSDGTAESDVFDQVFTVLPVNDDPVITAQSDISVDEDDSVIIGSNFFTIEDADGDNLFSVFLSEGENYSVSGDDKVIPDEDYNGSLSVPTLVEDANGGISNVFSSAITVVPVNDAPVATGVQLSPSVPTVNDDIVLSYTFFDVDGNSESGTQILWYKNGDEQPDYANTTTIPGTVTNCEEEWLAIVVPSDGTDTGENALSNEVTVCGANTPPVWSGDIGPFEIDEDSQENIIALNDYVSDSEQAYSQMVFSVLTNTGSDFLSASFSGHELVLSTLVENYYTSAPVILSLVVNDQGGYLDTTAVEVSIVPVNDSPTINSYTGQDSFDEDNSFTFMLDQFTVADVDNTFPDDFSLNLSMGNNYTLDGTTITPILDYFGPLEILAQVSDGDLDSDPFTVSITVAPVNDAPVIIAQTTLETLEDIPLAVALNDIVVDDIDNTIDDMTLLLDAGENYAVTDNIVRPAVNFFGALFVPAIVFDGNDSSGVWNLEVMVNAVNDTPVLVNPVSDIVVDEDSDRVGISLSGAEGAPYFDDPDIETGDQLDYTAYSASGALVSVQVSDSVYVDFLPDSNGVDTLFVMATDLGDLFAMDTILVTVNPVNDAPVIIAQTTLETPEDTPLTIEMDNLIVEDVDNTDEDMTILLDAGENYTVDGSTVTPALDFIGDLSVPAVVFDGQDSSNVFVLDIHVDMINDAPVVVNPVPDIVVDEDSDQVRFSLSGAEGAPYFDDPDIPQGDGLDYDAYSASDGLIDVHMDNDSVYVYFLPDSNGVDTVFVMATDLEGLTIVDTILVTVNPVNDAPVIIAQTTLETQEDTPLTIELDDLIVEDVDNTDEDLTILLSAGENYTVDGSTVTPALDFIGGLLVPAVVFDGQDNSNELVLNIQVIPVNDAPVVVNPVSDIVVDEDSDQVGFSLLINHGGAYFVDPDGDQLSYTATNASEGLIEMQMENDSVYVDFLPDSNGVDTIFVTATDLGGISVTDTILVMVNPVNDAPVILGSTELSTLEDSTITLSVDSLEIYDIDSDNFTLAVQAGENYTFDGVIVSPDDNYNGLLVVVVTVSDGDSVSAPFNLEVTVVPVNDTPLAFNLLTPENGITIIITAEDLINEAGLDVSWSASVDPDGDDVTYGVEIGAAMIDTLVAMGLTDISYNIPFTLMTAILDTLQTSEMQFTWTVYASDGIDMVYADEEFSLIVNADDVLGIDEAAIPEVFALHQNYPNPFNPITKIKYDLPENSIVNLVIYDIRGRQVQTIFSNRYQEAGYRHVVWNGLDKYGKPVPSGMYFYRISAADFNSTRKMILLK